MFWSKKSKVTKLEDQAEKEELSAARRALERAREAQKRAIAERDDFLAKFLKGEIHDHRH